MLVNNFLEHSAGLFPDKVALAVKGVRYTYSEIDGLANRVASAIVSGGLTKGERVVIFLDNSLEAVVSLFGVLKAGGVFVMLNPSMKAEKLTYVLNNCRAWGIISSASKFGILKHACADAPMLKEVLLAGDIGSPAGLGKRIVSLDGILKTGGAAAPSPRSIDADLATIIYTSGSTGFPKGVMMAHFNVVSAAGSITEYLRNTGDDIIFNTLPMSFDYGLYQVLMAFKTGATVILEQTFLYPYRMIDTLIKEKVTGFPIVPTICAILLQMDELKNHRFEHLRYITNTAAALPVPHIKKLMKLFPSAGIYSMYGLTECKRVSYLPPEELERRPSSVGKAMPNTEAYIVDEKGERVGPGVVGELVVRGSNIMRGYWEMPEETARILKQGEFGEPVLYTGDLFKMDEEGFLYFIGRKDDIIKSKGEKVSPKEIENMLHGIDGVVEAAVIGEPDPILGERIKAFVVLKDGVELNENNILTFCKNRLENFMVPQQIEIVKTLPKTDSGKVKKTDLKAAASPGKTL